MSNETQLLADFAGGLSYSDIPKDAVETAKSIMIDAVAVALFGNKLPWSKIVAATTLRESGSGRSPVLDDAFTRIGARNAALINGAFIHSFEFDSLRYPNAGVHAGSTVWPAVLAVGCERAISGKAALTALVAGCEVAFRIGVAAKGSFEKIGFHAPGVTGVFGAATAAGSILELDAQKMAHAFGIAGSMCAGLLAFSKAGAGGMIKPFHMGRAAEAGVLAAEMAEAGFEGPPGILEGRFGVLEAYSRDADRARLVQGLGTVWETPTACIKKYSCHVMAQTVVEGIRELVTTNKLEPAEIETVELSVAEKVLSHHASREPRDIGTSQYSVPMCAAIALYRDPSDPEAFLANPQNDQAIREWAGKVVLNPFHQTTERGFEWASKATIGLKSGRVFEVIKKEFEGMNSRDGTALARAKFQRLSSHLSPPVRDKILGGLSNLEGIDDFSLVFPESK